MLLRKELSSPRHCFIRRESAFDGIFRVLRDDVDGVHRYFFNGRYLVEDRGRVIRERGANWDIVVGGLIKLVFVGVELFFLMCVRANVSRLFDLRSLCRNVNIGRLPAPHVSGRRSIFRFASKVVVGRVLYLFYREAVRKSSVQAVVGFVRDAVGRLVFANGVMVKVGVVYGGVRARSAWCLGWGLNGLAHASGSNDLTVRVGSRGPIRKRIPIAYPRYNAKGLTIR